MLIEITEHVSHRPWPLPDSPWFMSQSWRDLLFAHWPVPVDHLRSVIPDSLEIDTYDGTAWISLVPFRMADVRLRRLPAVPGLSAFPEMNFRTYVVPRAPLPQQPGVWFFSLDAHNRAAVSIARRAYHLPYFHAHMSLTDTLDTIIYRSERTHRRAPTAKFSAEYAPTGGIEYAGTGTLEHWLSERYCLYAADSANRLHQAQVHHLPWPLQRAECRIEENTVGSASRVHLPGTAPLLQFARRLDVRIWPLRRFEP